MSEQASNISREARGLQQSLKEILVSRDPWDREVDFQRKNLRRHYLRLLLVHPYARESRDAQTHLWMQTSYAFIATYKQRIAALDRTVHAAPRLQQQQARQDGHGPVEYRKLMQRFRQFLAEEEKFWTQLVVRFRRAFALGEVQPALVSLGILAATGAPTAAGASEHPDPSQHAASEGRNHYQFPPEEETMAVAPTSTAERDGQLVIVSKALVCIGDIARYRELYNEAGGRPKAGHEDNVVLRRGRNRRGGAEVVPRGRNYEKAQNCYEQGRLLVPYEGNPWHQLAILSSYKKDAFESLVHYYRALCVRQPYETAAENLGTVLTKALEQWKARSKREMESGAVPPPPVAPRLRYEAFKEKVVILHALWRLRIDKMDSTSPNHAQTVCDDFISLISERGLPPDDICRTIVMSQGALWKHRMIRDSGSTTDSKTSSAALTASVIESRIFSHLLALHQALLDLGTVELAEPPPTDAANDLGQRITATFRRTLPALRIASKWLKANVKYVLQAQESDTTQDERGQSSGSHTSVGVAQFWESYSKFACALRRAFPLDRLPALAAPLEEDVDMRGFLPLRKMMGEVKVATAQSNVGASNGTAEPIAGQVHPNEEQLMRIADLLDDAQTLVEMENSPIMPDHDGFVLPSAEVIPPPVASQHGLSSREEHDPSGTAESEDDAMTDPVRAAFKHLDDSDWDQDNQAEENAEDDEEILYPRSTISPVHPHLSSPAGLGPVSPSLSPIGAPGRSLTRPSAFVTPTTPTTPRTAQDLLFSMLPLPRSHQQSSAPQPQLLFGSAPPNRLGHSIWSTSLDDPSANFPGSPSQPGQHHAHLQQYPVLPQESPQSIWSPFYQNAGQVPQSAPAGEMSSSFTLQQQPLVNGGHQRTASSPILVSRPFTNQDQSTHDPFEYSTMIPPQSQRPSHHAGYANFPTHPGAAQMFYGQEGYPDYRSHHMQHRHGSGVGHPIAPPPLSQVWGSSG